MAIHRSIMPIEEVFTDSKSDEGEFLAFTYSDIGDMHDSDTESDSDQGGRIFEPSQAYNTHGFQSFPILPDLQILIKKLVR